MSLVEMATTRAPFVGQSQLLNIYIDASTHPNMYAEVSALHCTTWSKGLKTGLYYLRIRPGCNPVQFTADKKAAKEMREVLVRMAMYRRSLLSVENNRRRGEEDELACQRAFVCRRDDREGCAACSS